MSITSSQSYLRDKAAKLEIEIQEKDREIEKNEEDTYANEKNNSP